MLNLATGIGADRVPSLLGLLTPGSRDFGRHDLVVVFAERMALATCGNEAAILPRRRDQAAPACQAFEYLSGRASSRIVTAWPSSLGCGGAARNRHGFRT